MDLRLDGLDEDTGWSAAEDLFPLAPPPHLKVLIAARQLAGDPAGQGWLNQLGWAAPGAAVRFTLDRPLTQSFLIRIPADLPSGSRWYLGVIVDSNNTLREQTKRNNATYIPIQIR